MARVAPLVLVLGNVAALVEALELVRGAVQGIVAARVARMNTPRVAALLPQAARKLARAHRARARLRTSMLRVQHLLHLPHLPHLPHLLHRPQPHQRVRRLLQSALPSS